MIIKTISDKNALFVIEADGETVRFVQAHSGAIMHRVALDHPDFGAKAARVRRNCAEAALAGSAPDSKSVFADPKPPRNGDAVSLTAHVLPILRAMGVPC